MAKDAKQLIEQVTRLTGRIDREAGRMHGVKICGLKSKNKREYSPTALQSAVGLYEGVNVNIDHDRSGEGDTPLDRRFGYLEGVHYSETPTPGLYGDLVYNRKHPRAEQIAEAAERMPHTLGLSHDAYAGKTRAGKEPKSIIVESITSVRSVDLVADPATTQGVFESTESKPMKQTCKQLIEAAYNLPLHGKLLEKFSKANEAAYKRLTEEIEPAEGASVQESADAAFRHVIVSVATDADAADAGKLVESVRKLQHEMLHGEAAEVIKESVEVKPEVFGIREATAYCKSLKFNPTTDQLTLLSESTAALGKEIAKEFCRLSLAVKETEVKAGPKGEPVKESTQPNQPEPFPATAAELLKKCA